MALDRRLLGGRLLRTQLIGALSEEETLFLSQEALQAAQLADPDTAQLASEVGSFSGSSGGRQFSSGLPRTQRV